jgi:hypothetical protein
MSGPSMSHRNKEKFTAVTSSKPNFPHVGLTEFIIVLLFKMPFTLVIVLVILPVRVREALI